jgi:tetratricopeptide (TPR) repeat protein
MAMPGQEDFWWRRNLRLTRGSGAFLWLAVGLLIAATVWAQAGPASEQLRQAQELVRQGKPEQAIPIYRELLKTFPDSPELRVDLSIAQFKARHYQDAMEQAKAALRLRPGLASANLFLGASYVELGEFGDAIPPLKKVLEAQPKDRNALLFLAQALSGARRYEEATEQFQRLSEVVPDNPKVWYGLGQSYEKLSKQAPGQRGDYAELARQAYERLMKLPRSRESSIHLAELRSERDEWAEAAKEWREALKIAPDDRQARAGLVWALYRARDYAAALALIDSIRKEGSDSAELKFLTGACWLNLEQPEKSIPYLEEAIGADGNLLSAQAGLGQALLRTGKAEEAIPHLKAALSIDEDGSGHFQLFRAYEAAGQKEAAKHALQDYKEFTKQLGLSNP